MKCTLSNFVIHVIIFSINFAYLHLNGVTKYCMFDNLYCDNNPIINVLVFYPLSVYRDHSESLEAFD